MQISYGVKFSDLWKYKTFEEALEQIPAVFGDIIEEVARDLKQTDLLRFYIMHENLQAPIVLPLRPLSVLTVDQLMDEIDKVLQSSKKLAFDESLVILIGTIESK